MFNLPRSTEVKKVIPKNAFDAYTNTKQKKLFADKVQRITWANKLSFDTVNLQGNDVDEIQVFDIELKEQFDIKDLLFLINKSIPYHIIFIIRYDTLFYISTSPKHVNPNNTDNAVIDYTFRSEWKENSEQIFEIELKNNLDWVYKNFCEQFKSSRGLVNNIQELVDSQKNIDALQKEIGKLNSAIKISKQFNKKVEMNMKLKQLEEMLDVLTGSSKL